LFENKEALELVHNAVFCGRWK